MIGWCCPWLRESSHLNLETHSKAHTRCVSWVTPNPVKLTISLSITDNKLNNIVKRNGFTLEEHVFILLEKEHSANLCSNPYLELNQGKTGIQNTRLACHGSSDLKSQPL